MKINILHITDAEMEIMKILWHTDRPLSTSEIRDAMPGRERRPSTIHTLVMRLADKDVVKYYKSGGMNYYFPYIMEEDYQFAVTKVFVNEVHNGDIVDMMKLLLSDLELNGETLERLRELVDVAVLPSKAIAEENVSCDERSVSDEEAEYVCHSDDEKIELIEDAKESKARTLTRWIGVTREEKECYKAITPKYSAFMYSEAPGLRLTG